MSSLFAAAKFGFFGFAAVPPQATYLPSSPYELPKGTTDERDEQKGFRPYKSPPNPGKYEDLSKEAKGNYIASKIIIKLEAHKIALVMLYYS
mgnify:CR=1 FL=1